MASHPTPSRVLVTGACSLVGRALVRRLCDEGHHVIAMDRWSTRGEEVGLDPRADFILPQEVVRARPIQAMFHMDTVHYDTEGETETWEQLFSVNVEGTQLMLQLAVALGATCFLMLSDSLVDDDSSEQDPHSYVASKALAETLIAKEAPPTLQVVSLRAGSKL
jgi:nucleoside-diphosphate-sugar epimerase